MGSHRPHAQGHSAGTDFQGKHKGKVKFPKKEGRSVPCRPGPLPIPLPRFALSHRIPGSTGMATATATATAATLCASSVFPPFSLIDVWEISFPLGSAGTWLELKMKTKQKAEGKESK